MSYQRMMRALSLENFGAVAHNDTLEHPAFIKKITGIDPFENPKDAMISAIQKLEMDWVYSVPKHANKFEAGEGKKESQGGYVTEWGFTGSAWSDHENFSDYEKVYDYDPFAKYSSEDSLRKAIRAGIATLIADQALLTEHAVVSGLYYTLLFQWFIVVFGWESFLIAAATEPDRFETCIRRFVEMSCIYAEEYAQSALPFFFCHDDLAMTRGLVFEPAWYRKHIFPAYERILQPFKKAGKKVMFVSDGNYSEVVDDLFAVGIDGIMVDWTFDLKDLLKKYGKTKVIAGNADAMILTFGSRMDVRKEVARCLDAGRDAGGYVIKCSNDLPQNIPLENIQEYFDGIYEYNAKAGM